MKLIITIPRLLVGLLFIFSGLIKANDPLGFSYKLTEYWEVFGVGFLEPVSLALSIFICVLEVGLGVMLILGVRMKLTSWLLLLMILFFTFLTFYSAYFDKVTDCGCFGDAIKLTPWESFTKDIVLLVLILFIFMFRKKIKPVISGVSGDIAAILSIAGALTFSLFCYWHLPVKDFRAYKVGANIYEEMNSGVPDKIKYTYILKNKESGENKEFERFPENWKEMWEYAETKEQVLEKGSPPKITDFSVFNSEGDELTEELLHDENFSFWVVAYNLEHSVKDAYLKLNEIAVLSDEFEYHFIGLTASMDDETENFRHEVQAMFPFYYADEIVLKTMIRSNPGLFLIKNGTIIAKWHFNDIPAFEQIQSSLLK